MIRETKGMLGETKGIIWEIDWRKRETKVIQREPERIWGKANEYENKLKRCK
jgi:hypothetical protein